MKEVNVHIAEIKIAHKGEILKTILGSCVGIGFIWKNKNICGLAHCLLPETPIKTFTIGGRFVDQAIPSLMAMMKIRKKNISEIEVIVAGGGNMTQAEPARAETLVGHQNVQTAQRELKKMGLRICEIETGGDVGRKLTLFSNDGTYIIEKIPRLLK